MISAALYEYLAANSSAASIYSAQAPQSAALPCIVYDKIGDSRSRHWAAGITTAGLIDSEFELTVWATTQLAALNEANTLLALMDNLQDTWYDNSTSPRTTHRIAFLEVDDNGWQFNPAEKRYSASLFLTITHT